MVSARGKGICQLTVGYAFNGVTWRVIDQLWGQDGWLSGKFSRVKDRPMLSAQGGVADVTKPSPVTPAKQRWDPCSGPPTDWVVLFEFPFSLVGKSTMAFPTGLWRIQVVDPGPPLFLDQQKFFGDTGPHTGPPPSLISKSGSGTAGNSWCIPKSRYTDGGSEHGLRRCFTDRLNKSYVSSVAEVSPLG